MVAAEAEATIQILQPLLEKVLSVPASNICTSGASIQPEWSDHAPEPGSKTVLIQLVFLKCNSHL